MEQNCGILVNKLMLNFMQSLHLVLCVLSFIIKKQKASFTMKKTNIHDTTNDND